MEDENLTLNSNYRIKFKIGKGAFGKVYEAEDKRGDRNVALKIIKDKDTLIRQAAIEVSILKLLALKDPDNKKNIVRMFDHFNYNRQPCIVFELLGLNIYTFMKNNDFEPFSYLHTKQTSKQLLVGLDFIKLCDIIHADLKPENIVVVNYNEEEINIKIIDFGSACRKHDKIHAYVQSRFYRAPEIVLARGYSYEIDMWSFGCIIFELLFTRPIFSSRNETELITAQTKTLGIPSSDYLRTCGRARLFFLGGRLIRTLDSKGKIIVPGERDISNYVDSLAAEFIKNILKWEPESRLTPSEALEHPFLKNN